MDICVDKINIAQAVSHGTLSFSVERSLFKIMWVSEAF